MPNQIHTTSKNTVLDDLTTKLKKNISDAGFHIVEQSWSNPIANIWSVTICDKFCSVLITNGIGHSKKNALSCALNEFTKYLSTRYFWTDYYLGDEISNNKYLQSSNEKWFRANSNDSWPEGVLNDELCQFYNPVGELNASNLIDLNSCNHERGICCIPYERVGTDESTNFPINLVDNIYARNGISSGNTNAEARVNALSEIIEHYVQFKVIAEGISLPNIPAFVLNQYPHIQSTIKEIEVDGCSLLIKDASLDDKYPVISAVLLNSNKQSVSSCFAAHPKFDIAFERVLTKLIKNNHLNQFDNFSEAGFDLDEISSPNNLEKQFIESQGVTAWDSLSDNPDFDFIDWSNKFSNINTEQEYKQLCEMIHREGNDIFISDYSDMDLYTCRVIVPGMSEVYPVDDLVWENNNLGASVRDQILKPNKTIQECERLIENLEDLNQEDEYLVSNLIGMPADTDSIFSDLCVAELILLLALKTQDNERMQEGCEWLLHFKQINPYRLKTYKCINTILQLDNMTDYASVLEKLYTREVLSDALALINGEDVFPLVSDWKMHASLIVAYKKILNNQDLA